MEGRDNSEVRVIKSYIIIKVYLLKCWQWGWKEIGTCLDMEKWKGAQEHYKVSNWKGE